PVFRSRCDVAPMLRARADADTLRAEEVTFHVAFDVHGMREDIRADLALRADRQRVVAQLHRAVDLALDDEVFLAPQVPVDVDRRADDRRLPRDRRGAPRGGGGRGVRQLALCRLAIRLRSRVLCFVLALLADIEHLVPPRCRRTSIERSVTRTSRAPSTSSQFFRSPAPKRMTVRRGRLPRRVARIPYG